MDDIPLHATTTAKRRRRSALAVITGACLGVAGLTGAGSAVATTPATGATGFAAPAVGSHAPAPGSTSSGTHFLDHAALLTDLNDKSWYESNIPFVDLPDSTIQDVLRLPL